MADRIVVMEGGHIQQVGAPAEISQHPANVFVAAFMGDNNILRASVSEVTGDQVILDASVGHLAMATAGRSFSPGEEVTVAVRANCVRLAGGEHEARPNEFTCTLAATEYLGDVVKVHMRAGDHSLLAKAPEQRYPELVALTGKPVTASWDAGDVQLLSA
jgi:putative spermidine/putrescine transport system ATP-binding protein